jgi:hypothetical protein
MTQRLLLAAGMHQQQLPELSMEQVLVRHGPNLRSLVVNSLVDSVREKVTPILDGNNMLKGKIGLIGRQHLVSRLSEQAVYMGGNEAMADLAKLLATDEVEAQGAAEKIKNQVDAIVNAALKADGNEHALSHDEARALADRVLQLAANVVADRSGISLMEEAINNPEVFVNSVVDSWRNRLETYVPTGKSQAFDRYKQHGAVSSGAPDHVPEMLKKLYESFPSATDRAFDRARTATVRDANASDIPVVAALYQSAVLRDDALSLMLAREGDTEEAVQKRINKLRRRVAKGAFVRPLSEEKLEEEMSFGNILKTGLQLKMELLETDDAEYVEKYGHGVLAFASHYRAAAQETPSLRRKRLKTMRHYIERGETGGKTQYAGNNKQWLLENLDDVVLCGDIRGVEKYAPERLGAWVFGGMMHEHEFDSADRDPKRDKILLAYRLRHLKFACTQPLIRDLDTRGILFENDKSYELTRTWGFRHVGKDYNPHKEGKHIRRVVEEGEGGAVIDVNPEWEVAKASLRDAAEHSASKWLDVQITHGDVTKDVPARSLLRWRPGK